MVDARKLDSVYPLAKNKLYLYTLPQTRRFLDTTGYIVVPVIWAVDYNIAKLKLAFLDPKTRNSKLDTLMLARLVKVN